MKKKKQKSDPLIRVSLTRAQPREGALWASLSTRLVRVDECLNFWLRKPVSMTLCVFILISRSNSLPIPLVPVIDLDLARTLPAHCGELLRKRIYLLPSSEGQMPAGHGRCSQPRRGGSNFVRHALRLRVRSSACRHRQPRWTSSLFGNTGKKS